MLLAVNTAPDGSEGPDNACRRAGAPAPRGDHVGLFLDLAWAVDVSCGGTWCGTRGLTADHLMPEVRVAGIHGLVATVARSDTALSF